MIRSVLVLLFGLVLGGVDAQAAALTASECEALRARVRVDIRSGKADFETALRDAETCAALPRLSAAQRAAHLRDAAKICALLGDPEGAEKSYTLALAARAGDAEAAYGLAQVISGRPQEALRYAELAARRAATPRRQAAAHRLVGTLRVELGHVTGAEAAFERALALAGDDMDALQEMVRAKRDRPGEAAVYAQRASEAAQAAPLWLRPAAGRLSARIWLELNNGPRAKAELERVLALEADDLEALEMLVGLKQTPPQAEAVSPAAILEAPRRAARASGEGPALRALREDPEDFEGLLELLELRRLQGRLPEAAELAGRFMDAVPGAPNWQQMAAYLRICKAWLSLGDMEMAARSISHARNMDARSVEILILAARLGVGDGAADDATPADALAAIARARLELGDAAGAERDLKRALELFPDHLNALKDFVQLKLGQGLPKEALVHSDHLLRASEALKSVSTWEFAARFNQLPWQRAELYGQRARIDLALGDEAGALRSLARALALVPEEAGALAISIDLYHRKAQGQRDAKDKVGARRSLKLALAYCGRAIAAAAKAPPETRAALYEQRALLEREAGDAAGAAASLKRALELVPDRLQALVSLAGSELESGRPREALAYCERALAASEKAPPEVRADLYERRATLQRELGDASGAQASLERALALVPDRPRLLSILTRLALEAGRPQEALTYSARELAASGDAPPEARADLHEQRARLQRELGDASAAGESLRQALALAPRHRGALEASARAALAEGRLPDAKSDIARALEASAQAPPAERASLQELRARVELAEGDAAAAARSLRRALSLVPRHLPALMALARLELDTGRPRQALAHGVQALKAAEGLPPEVRAALYEQQALIALTLKDPAAAAASLKRALELVPGRTQALASLLRLELEARRPRVALYYAESLVHASRQAAPSQRAAAYRQRAQVKLLLKDATGARADLESALAAFPEDLAALGQLLAWDGLEPYQALALVESHRPSSSGLEGVWLALRGLTRLAGADRSGAEADLRAALDLDAKGVCSGALFQERRDRVDLLYFDLCVERFPGESALYSDRGVARYQRGQREGAVSDLRKAAELRPGDVQARRSLASALEALKRPTR